MADNTTLPVGAGGDTIADEDIAGVKYQKIKLIDATAGSITPIGTAANPLQVTNTSLPLPTGAATGAKQDTGNTSVASIDAKTPALGQQLAAASVPVVLTAIQQAALTPPAAITGFALDATVAKDASLVTIDADIKANQPRTVNVIAGYALEAGHLATLDANTPALGQKAMAGSSPVVIASDQIVPVSASSLPLPTNAAQENSGALGLLVQLMTDIRAELRILNENTAQIGNIPHDMDARRADPYYLN